MAVCSCSAFQTAVDRQFTADKAAKELKAYRKGRLGPTTRRLRDGIVEIGLNRGSLLDVGAGVGALTFELLDRGIKKATVADASVAYVAAAKDEAARLGRSESVQIVHGDLLETAPLLPTADLVTLDRVVCCHPSYQPLLEEATRHAAYALALSYPRNWWFVRARMWLENAKRRRTSGFRTFVHPPHLMRQIIEGAGFDLVHQTTTPIWAIDIFVRRRGG
jgi:16S rRNA G966 N2-methylase RsmD